ncbi:DNA-directed RNA polymerase subunit beta' [candidate division WOR-3 bacterium]|nr:DNA-directed RNA polymerase subunit beta' [candidate division WOR-3 bacterium]
MNKDQASDLSIDLLKLSVASPTVIRDWSNGEVVNSETINYRTQKPEPGGLFCEKIFGPVKDYECNCGKYKHIRYRGVVCERCGVEVTSSKSRRERMGHIELAVPVAHIWFYKVTPSRIALLLNMTQDMLQRILFYEAYIVLDTGSLNEDNPYGLKRGGFISEEQKSELEEKMDENAIKSVQFGIGGQGIREALQDLDLEKLTADLRSRIKIEKSEDAKSKMLKRLKVVEAFRNSNNHPEDMILTVIPVIPPELRPLVALDGGRFASSDLNDLYRRVISRNNRLKSLISIKAPDIIIRNEMRMLQDAVDALFDNSRRAKNVKGKGNKPLRSLADVLKGKQGRFRSNLLGKRVDYSGRSVIVVGPRLKLHQCGLPKEIALELYKPFIIRKLEERGHAQSIKGAERLLEKGSPEVWSILEEIVKDHPVLLNRAPTLHRLGIQAFQPVLIEEKAIQVHPLVCTAFNADFDGDQMAVHLPLSFEAQSEAYMLMMSSNNLLSPANGTPIVAPTKDLVLGVYYLTKEKSKAKGEGMHFSSLEEIEMAREFCNIDLHALIKFPVEGRIIGLDSKGRDEDKIITKEIITTTPGRVIFNQILPEGMPFYNRVIEKKILAGIIADVNYMFGNEKTAIFLDDLKDLGFRYATFSGVTFGMLDLVDTPERPSILKKTQNEVEKIRENFRKGQITENEKYQRTVEAWTKATNEVEERMIETFHSDREGFNPIYMMVSSGARGSREQVRQLAGIRGLMTRPQKKITGQKGEIIESPVLSNFKEGLKVLEYFISSHGARKGLTDTALKTSEAGYLTRRLIDVAQDVIITEEDCGTIKGIEIQALTEGGEIIEPLSDRIEGRFALDDIEDPQTHEIIVREGEVISKELALKIEYKNINKVKIRSVLTCEAERGLCQKCYGKDLSTGKIVSIGESVGIIAAQSIGEPGTQLTLRTFHIGGTATRIAQQSVVKSIISGAVKFQKIKTIKKEIDDSKIVISRNGEIVIKGREREVAHKIPHGSILMATEGAYVDTDTPLYEWDPFSDPILSETQGIVRYKDLIENLTMRYETHPQTGEKQVLVVEHKERGLIPAIEIEPSKQGKKKQVSLVPIGTYIIVENGKRVTPGDIIGKIPRESSRSRDITAGLPRVEELFEMRRPKNAAIISEIKGEVKFLDTTKGSKIIKILSEVGDDKEYLVPYGKHILVHEGQFVEGGEKLTDGQVFPPDILQAKGPLAVQEFLLNEVQEVYRLQGVKISDRHIALIIRQLLRRVKIEDSGDTNLIEGEIVDSKTVTFENSRILKAGGKPATYRYILLGVTKTALTAESFISAASFQETTKVLTSAAIEGKRDTLEGIKENVIVGNLIPAGTGLKNYRTIRVEGEDEVEEKKEDSVVILSNEEQK